MSRKSIKIVVHGTRRFVDASGIVHISTILWRHSTLCGAVKVRVTEQGKGLHYRSERLMRQTGRLATCLECIAKE